MIRAGAGFSTAAEPGQAAHEATAAALVKAGLRVADAALCFATSELGAGYPLILRTVSEQAGTREVAGCGASGVISSGNEIEGGAGVSVLVIGGGEITARSLFVPDIRGRAIEAARELAAAVRPALGPNNLLCLFPDTYNLQPEPLLATLARELPGVTIVGGGASEDGSIGETFQFCADVVSSNSVAGMLLAGDFDLNVGASLACTPLGSAHRVTAVQDNVLVQLDGRPAFEVFTQAIGPLADDLARAAAFVFAGVPIDPDAERLERGRFFVRNVVGFNQEHGLLAVGYRPKVGELLGFVLRDGERSRADLKATLEEMSMRAPVPPAFGLYFDCVSRGAALYQVPNHDTAYIEQYLGPTPLAGFFSGFEIGPLGDSTGLLQYTGVLALVAEKRRQ